MAEQRVYTEEEFLALPDDEKVPGMLIDFGDKGRDAQNYLKYTFDAVTDDEGIFKFDEKMIPANINQVMGYGVEFPTLNTEQLDTVKFEPNVKEEDSVNVNFNKFSASFKCNKPNTPIRIKFEYL